MPIKDLIELVRDLPTGTHIGIPVDFAGTCHYFKASPKAALIHLLRAQQDGATFVAAELLDDGKFLSLGTRPMGERVRIA